MSGLAMKMLSRKHMGLTLFGFLIFPKSIRLMNDHEFVLILLFEGNLGALTDVAYKFRRPPPPFHLAQRLGALESLDKLALSAQVSCTHLEIAIMHT